MVQFLTRVGVAHLHSALSSMDKAVVGCETNNQHTLRVVKARLTSNEGMFLRGDRAADMCYIPHVISMQLTRPTGSFLSRNHPLVAYLR